MIKTQAVYKGNLILDVLYSQGTKWKLKNQSIDQIYILFNIHIMCPTALTLFTHDAILRFHEGIRQNSQV